MCSQNQGQERYTNKIPQYRNTFTKLSINPYQGSQSPVATVWCCGSGVVINCLFGCRRNNSVETVHFQQTSLINNSKYNSTMFKKKTKAIKICMTSQSHDHPPVASFL